MKINRDHQGRVIDFGRTVADYERYRPGFPENFFDRLTDLQWISPGQRVLDLGTGTGSLALGFAARGLVATGLDIAPELLDVARLSATDQGLEVNFVERSAERTGQAASSFDLVSAGQCWWWFDSDGVIREANRILAPDGRLLIASFSYLVDVPFSQIAWRGRMRTCNGVGSALSTQQVEPFDTELADLLAQEFPGELTVPHRIFATSGIRA